MVAGTGGSALDKALGHPLRKRLVAALWHSSEPLGAGRIADEYLEGDTDWATVAYHLWVLESAGVVRRAEPPAPRVVLGGGNAVEAIRRLGLGRGPSDEPRDGGGSEGRDG